MRASTTLKLSLFLSLLSVSSFGFLSSLTIPSMCSRLQCPSYDVIEKGNDYEIRLFNSSSTVWMSTSTESKSLVGASTTGFLRLFPYIQGNNNLKKKMNMTTPVIVEVLPNDSKFVVSFYMPKQNQENLPTAEGLSVQRWTNNVYAAVRQFGGYVSDSGVVKEVAALKASIAGTKWSSAIAKSHSKDGPAAVYTVAQYNSPFEFINRVNEIWFLFVLDN